MKKSTYQRKATHSRAAEPCYIALILLAGTPVFAQNVESRTASRGFTFYEQFQSSASTLGVINKLDSSVGYTLNSHFSVDGGLPVYFVQASGSTTAASGSYVTNAVGDAYVQLRLTMPNRMLNFASTLTGTAPTGNNADGFSTGHATVDWSNYFGHSFSRLTPFVDLGIANSVSDEMFFVRPYTSYGFVIHEEGGARYRIARRLNIGGSIYGIEPFGQQMVVSRVVHGQIQTGATGASTSGTSAAAATSPKGKGVFESSKISTGAASIAQDHGASVWAQYALSKSITLSAGYTRSEQYSLNTLFFGIGVNLGQAFRSLGI